MKCPAGAGGARPRRATGANSRFTKAESPGNASGIAVYARCLRARLNNAAQKTRRKSLTSPAPGLNRRGPLAGTAAAHMAKRDRGRALLKNSGMTDPLGRVFSILEHPVQNALVHPQAEL